MPIVNNGPESTFMEIINGVFRNDGRRARLEDCRNFGHIFDGFPPLTAVNRSAPMRTPKPIAGADRHRRRPPHKQ
jgi:hypothetical protein